MQVIKKQIFFLDLVFATVSKISHWSVTSTPHVAQGLSFSRMFSNWGLTTQFVWKSNEAAAPKSRMKDKNLDL